MFTLESINPITHLDVNKMQSGGTKSGKVKLVIGGHALTRNPEGTKVEVAFQYQDEQGNALPSKLGGKPFTIEQGVKELSQSINSNLPADDNIVDRLGNEVKAIAFQKFAEDFDIETSDIQEAAQA